MKLINYLYLINDYSLLSALVVLIVIFGVTLIAIIYLLSKK